MHKFIEPKSVGSMCLERDVLKIEGSGDIAAGCYRSRVREKPALERQLSGDIGAAGYKGKSLCWRELSVTAGGYRSRRRETPVLERERSQKSLKKHLFSICFPPEGNFD